MRYGNMHVMYSYLTLQTQWSLFWDNNILLREVGLPGNRPNPKQQNNYKCTTYVGPTQKRAK